jgi:transposase-like protein
MSILSEPHFHDEAAAIARLEAIVWPNGPCCPRCGGFDRITPVNGGRAGLRRCGPCKREFTVTVGTLFERSHIKLHLWFQAAHLMASSKKGISAHQLHRTLKVAYRTAWFMEHRLREAMRDGHFADELLAGAVTFGLYHIVGADFPWMSTQRYILRSSICRRTWVWQRPWPSR